MSWDELPGQLNNLARVFQSEAATARTAEHLRTESRKYQQSWKEKSEVRTEGLPLPVPRNQGLHPVGCDPVEAALDFQFGPVNDEGLPTRAEYQVRVDALLEAGENTMILQDHWRIDTDRYPGGASRTPANEEGRGSDEQPIEQAQGPKAGSQGKTPKEPHPFYHFQRGGYGLDEFARLDGFIPSASTPLAQGTYRALMLYPGPRIACLPMDPVLAIDFCIGQNDGLVWHRLRNKPEYSEIIAAAQKRLWNRFFEMIQTTGFRKKWLGPLLI